MAKTQVKPQDLGSTSQGGTVTQLTSKATGVTLSKRCGAITMHNAALAAGAEVSFTVTNTLVTAHDIPIVVIKSGATAGAYNLEVDLVSAGSFRLSLSNQSAGSLNEAVVIQFSILPSSIN